MMTNNPMPTWKKMYNCGIVWQKIQFLQEEQKYLTKLMKGG